jgi:hypothetical protein
MKKAQPKQASAKGASAAKPQPSPKVPPAATPSEAQRLAAGILEVLAGLRSPPAAAELLAISLPRYYQLEARALEGLVAALAPRPLGKQPSLENRVKQLEKELEAARRACARQEALVRLTQRSLGLAAITKAKTAPAAHGNTNRAAPRFASCWSKPPLVAKRPDSWPSRQGRLPTGAGKPGKDCSPSARVVVPAANRPARSRPR